jgi:hypothetical protein
MTQQRGLRMLDHKNWVIFTELSESILGFLSTSDPPRVRSKRGWSSVAGVGAMGAVPVL